MKHKFNIYCTGTEININAKNDAKKLGIEILDKDLKDVSENYFGKYDVDCAFQVIEHIANIKNF